MQNDCLIVERYCFLVTVYITQILLQMAYLKKKLYFCTMIKNLQSLRGVAAILIFYHHYGFESAFVQSFGDFAVVFFMMLSGFVLYLSTEKNKNTHRLTAYTTFNNFLLYRLFRIYPLYLVCWIAAIMVLPYSGSMLGKILGIFAIQSWFPESSIYFAGNAVAWFVCDLFFCYMLFLPMYGLLINRPRLAYAIMFVYLGCYFLTVMYLPDDYVHAIVYISPIMQFANFMIGMLICKHYKSNKRSFMKGSFIELMLLLSIFLMFYFYKYIPPRYAYGSYWWIISGLTIFYYAKLDTANGLINKVLQSGTLLKVGHISFSLYMIHFIGISLWRRLLIVIGWESEFIYVRILQSIILLLLLIIASNLVTKHIEEPLNNKLKSRMIH